MKKLYLILVTAFVLIISFVVCYSQALDLSTPPTYITGHSLGVKGLINFFAIRSSLSANCIQVRKTDNETSKEYLLENYDGYDNLVGYSLHGDSLVVFLRGGYELNDHFSNAVECDTFHLNINNVKWEIE